MYTNEKTYQYADSDDVQQAFWEQHPQFTERPGGHNKQTTDCRCAFVDFVDYLEKSGQISAELAQGVTL